ncbi:MAG: YgiQ family radical SAM protein [Anaerostipes sp.]|nr:YgiQ family radical SAM protein [Anaerostipes sp.]
MAHNFLPINQKEMKERGWKQVDFVYVSGDAYVDHPSFGAAIITRLLESKGYKIGVLAQPDWKKEDAIKEFGRPRLGFMVSGGNMDSMVNHYTVAKKHRKIDAYTPGGVMGKRPDRAVTVYGNLIRRVFPDIPIIIGGIEASLRRLAHYDYWSDSLKKSILLDSQADILSYGMGERSIVDIADALNSGIAVSDLNYIPGTVYKEYKTDYLEDAICLPNYQELEVDKRKYAESFYTQYCNTDPFSAKRLVEAYGKKLYVVQNPPAKPLTQEEMDEVYALPYERTYHPSYEKAGGVSAIKEVKFSLVSNRGCFGGCSFCALTFHQGRIVQTRSHDSIIEEAEKIIKEPEFKGYIHDVGGPTANFRHPSCEKQLRQGVCKNRQCLFPKPCKNLTVDHKDYIKLLRKLRNLPKVKKVFIRSGIRFDYVMADSSDDFIKELCQYHVSGQLKVAPEHITDHVLDKMGKPEVSVYKAFVKKYNETNEKLGLKQYLVPYLISSHPGSTLEDAIALAEAVRDMGYMPEQVQDFYPTPSTISACMYYTGLDPRTMKEVYVVRNPHEKALQRALIQYRNPKMYELVKEALLKAERADLIGYEKKCLIRPRQSREERESWANGKPKSKARGKNQTKSQTYSKKKGQQKIVAKKKKKAIRNVHKKK